MADPKKKLQSQLKNAENRRSNAAAKAEYEISLNRNKGLTGDALTSGTAYNKAYYELQQADREVKRIQGLITNYKEPVKAKSKEEEILENIRNIGSGKEIKTEVTPDGTKGSAPSTRDIDKEIIAAPKFLYNKPDPEKKAFADGLTAAGYKVTNWKNIEDLVGRYQEALSDNKKRNTSFGINQTLDEFLSTKVSEQTGTGGATTTVSISSPTEAAGYINQAFQTLLGRYATPEEIKSLTPKLNKAEKDNPSKTISGVSTGGIDRGQFLTDIILATPEYKQRKESKQSTIRQDLANTARANGLDLDKNFGANAADWIKRIESGEKADAFKQLIRNTAKLGLPDKVAGLLDQGIDLETVYSPYKNAMASVLEINPATINLSDPTLRGAIGPDKEMSLYEFQKALRKDPRWQYTNNARENVFQSVNKVLQDFGFQG